MGTLFVLEAEVPGTAPVDLDRTVWAELDRVDRLMSSYRPDSDIRRLGSETCRPIAAQTASVLGFSLHLCRSTRGAFDVTVAPLLDLWGLRQGPGRVPSRRELDAALQTVGCDKVQLGRNCARLMAGSRISLGGVAKGAALDRARDRLVEHGVTRASLDLGGQLHFIGAGHLVALPHPRHPCQVLAEFLVADESVSTSAATERYVEVNGRRYGHILDPRTGWPAAGVASVTVTHPSAMVADGLSTALFVLGPAGLDWVEESYPRAGVLLVLEPGPAGELSRRHLWVGGSLVGHATLHLPAAPRGAAMD